MTKTKIDTIIEDFDNGKYDWIDTKDKLRDLQGEYESFFTGLNKKLRLWQVNCLIILIIAMGVSFWYMFGGAGECQDNPFQYGADLIADKFEGDLQCECYFYSDGERTDINQFSFQNKGFKFPMKSYLNSLNMSLK